MFKRIGVIGLFVLVATGISFCSSSDNGSVTLRIAVPGAASRLVTQPGKRGFPGCSGSEFGIGYGTLTSLQYYFTRIQLCEDMTITGSGYSDTKGCVTLFTTGDGLNAYDTYKVADAIADTSSYIDLLDATSRAKMSATTLELAAGTYKYGIIETRKPVKFAATVDFGGGDTMTTCGSSSGTVSVSESGSDTELCEATSYSGNFTESCTAETITIGTTGGGTFFKFLEPITIESGETYALDLAFRPEQSVSANVQNAKMHHRCCGTDYSDAGTKLFTIPLVDVAPILRTTSQKTIRESYTIPVTSGTLAIDLYFAGALTEVGTGNVLAAGARLYVDTGTCVTSAPAAYSPDSISIADNKVTLTDYQGKSMVAGLTRSTSATAASVGTVTVDETSFGGTNPSLSATAQFVGVSEL